VAENRAELARKKEERENPYLYLDVCVISDDSFRHHTGFDLTSADLVPSDPAAPKIYRILRTSKFGGIAQQIAKERKLKSEQIRFWEMVNRQNKTIRPDQPLLNYDLTFQEILGKNFKRGKFYVWVEVTDIAEEGKISWPESQDWNGSILLFLKHVDGVTKTATGVGHVYVRKNDKISSLSLHITKTMNWPAGTQLSFFEVMSEIKREYPKTNGISIGN
jgi:ubiquitin carboxyl-terminal hydrolase 7